ncbi:MAG: hypothetical protein IPM23_18725 [Candidatus Melainabacteria bacterium]|nr:hypothetical protein [Candidatus Melainabacteria bacterium]
MDADAPRIPDYMMIAKGDQTVEEKYGFLNELARKRGKTTIVSYGPILMMELGSDWKERGVHVIAGRPAWQNYRLESPLCTLRVYRLPVNHHESTASFVRDLVENTTGPVSKEKWRKITIFGGAGNPRFFTIESIEVLELGGKKLISMVGQHIKNDGAREKSIHVSLSGDWKDSYECGIGTTSDRDNFDKAVARFDQALKTVRWKDSL